MAVDEIKTIDMIVEGKRETYFVIMEGRKWSEIPHAGIQLMAKIRNLQEYAKTKEAKKKYGKKIKVVLHSKYVPPPKIRKMLKEFSVYIVKETKKTIKVEKVK